MNLPGPRQPSHPDLTVPAHPYLGVHLGVKLNLVVQLYSIGILAAAETKPAEEAEWRGALREGKGSQKARLHQGEAIT